MILAVFGVPESVDIHMSVDQVSQIIDDNWDDFRVSTEALVQHSSEATVKRASHHEAIAKLIYRNGKRIMIGDFYFLYCNDPFEANLIPPEVAYHSSLRKIFHKELLTEITIKDNLIQYHGDQQYSPVKKGFWGLYYSIDGDPKIVGYSEDSKLVEGDGGWSISTKTTDYYRTENIRENFYYYEGKYAES